MSERKVLTKADIVTAVQDKMGLSRRATARVVEDMFDIMKNTLENGESVKISGFGNFEIREKQARPGRNPKTGEEVTISARRVLTFKPSGVLRKAIREGGSAEND